MAKSPEIDSHGPFRTAALALSVLMAACADGSVANAEDPERADIVPVSATTNVQSQVDVCIAEAIKEAEELGMTDAEIKAELQFLKDDCDTFVSQEIRLAQMDTSIANSQARIDAANARQQELAEQAVRDAEGRSQ